MSAYYSTKRSRSITAFLAMLIVVYCSVGVCTSLFAAATTKTDDPHAHHMAAQADHAEMSQSHCNSSESCEWSLNPVADPSPLFEAYTGFFLVYLIASVSLIVFFHSLLQTQRQRYAFARNNFFQHAYPRLHLQQAVFLN